MNRTCIASAGASVWLLLCLALPGGLTASALAADDLRQPRWTGETMGCIYSVRLVDSPLNAAQLAQLKREVDDRLVEVNRQMSHYLTNSELAGFNRSASGQAFKVSPEFAQIMRFCQKLNQESDGVFDPTLGPLINLWGFGPKGAIHEPPPDAEVARVRQIVGCRHLRVTERDELVKDIPGLQLNLGAVTKGYGVDEVVRIVRAHGVTNLFVNISGEVYVGGHSPKGQPWRIGIDTPEFGALPGDEVSAVIALSNSAISTSGNYRQFFKDKSGKVFAHILDARTGRPVTHNLASVSIVAADCMTADALATATFALGPERGLQFIETHPNAAAFFIVRNPDGTFRQFASKRFPPVQALAKSQP